jgi:glycosyltransferase involved in cell wall biosynthesis
MEKRFSLDLVIPVLNEEATLAAQVARARERVARLLPENIVEWRLVIVDNGSTDRTGSIAAGLAARHDNVAFMRVHEKGVGLALKSAWQASMADLIGYMDLDLATDLAHLPEALNALTMQNCDLVYATRLHPDAVVIGRSTLRAVTSRVFNTVLKLYLGTRFSDGMCGFKFMWRRSLAPIVHHGAQSDGWFFATELLVVAEWLGLRLRELPVHWTDDRDSRARIVALTFEYLPAMHRLRMRKRAIKAAA